MEANLLWRKSENSGEKVKNSGEKYEVLASPGGPAQAITFYRAVLARSCPPDRASPWLVHVGTRVGAT